MIKSPYSRQILRLYTVKFNSKLPQPRCCYRQKKLTHTPSILGMHFAPHRHGHQHDQPVNRLHRVARNDSAQASQEHKAGPGPALR